MPKQLNTESFQKEVKEKEGLVLVDFWAEWCTPCKILGPIIEKVATQVEGKAEIAKVDVDANPAIAGEFGVMSIPTVILFKDGQAVEQIIGVRPESVYLDLIENYASA